jgi:hypothetical protein
VAHPLRTRREAQDPEVRDAEVRPVKPLALGLPVANELAPERGLREGLPSDRNRAAVGFEEEVGVSAVLRLTRESQTEDAVRL